MRGYSQPRVIYVSGFVPFWKRSAWCHSSISFNMIVFQFSLSFFFFKPSSLYQSAIFCFPLSCIPLIKFHLSFFFPSPPKLLAQRPLFRLCYSSVSYLLLSHHLTEWWGSLLPSLPPLSLCLFCFASPSLSLSLSLGLSPSFPLWVFVGWNEEGALSWVVRVDLHVPCVRQDELWHTHTFTFDILHLTDLPALL